MQEPSGLVAPQLLPHLHLISSFRYPQLFKPDYQKAFEFLRNAPSLINDLKPVSWTYLAPPPPAGTILLEWMPPLRPPTQFSSDGYAWLDMEQITRVEVEGYVMEVFFLLSGFNPEAKNTHLVSRYRFRLLSKSNPNLPGDDPDPSLWIVQYCRSEAPVSIPQNFFAARPDVHQLLQDRKTIERLGVLSRKEFMFKDRANWPSLPFPNPNVPGGQMPPGATPGQIPGAIAPTGQSSAMAPPHPGVAAQYFQAAQGMPVAPHPAWAKKARPGQAPDTAASAASGTGAAAQPALAAPPRGAAGATVTAAQPPAAGRAEQPVDEATAIHIAQQIAADTLREEEENAVLGDSLDHLTPRDISLMRYMRHHEWMDEVLNSPYSTLDILPVDLGLGLAGALEPLTKGLQAAVEPVPMPRRNGPMVMVVPPIPVVKKIDKQLYEDVEARVKKFVDDGEEELRQMRQAHAKRMAELRKNRVYGRAEKRLRDIWNGEVEELKNPSSSWLTSADERGEEAGAAATLDPYELAEETARGVERVMKIRIVPKDKVELVNRGGLIDGDPNEHFRTDKETAAAAMGTRGGPPGLGGAGGAQSHGGLSSVYGGSGPGSTAVPTPVLDTNSSSMMADVDQHLHPLSAAASVSASASHAGMSVGGRPDEEWAGGVVGGGGGALSAGGSAVGMNSYGGSSASGATPSEEFLQQQHHQHQQFNSSGGNVPNPSSGL